MWILTVSAQLDWPGTRSGARAVCAAKVQLLHFPHSPHQTSANMSMNEAYSKMDVARKSDPGSLVDGAYIVAQSLKDQGVEGWHARSRGGEYSGLTIGVHARRNCN